MNTDYLREFITFAEHMNFTAASRALHISQPSLSRHMAELERAYGCGLIDRDAPVMHLTHCGEVLLEQASALIASEDSLMATMGEASREPYRSLCVERYHRSPRIQKLVSDALSAVKSEHDGYVVMRRTVKQGESIPDLVLRGALDVGIVTNTTDLASSCPVGHSDGLRYRSLEAFRERLFFVVTSDSPLASRQELSIADLKDTCFVFPLYPEFGRCPVDVATLCAARGFDMRSRPHKLDDVDSLGLMTIDRNDVFIVVESAVENASSFYLQNPALRIIPCSEDIWSVCYFIFRDDDTNPALVAFLQKVDDAEKPLTRGKMIHLVS